MATEEQEQILEIFRGKDLISRQNLKVKADEALQCRVVGLYFSAHWCPPCRMFTPKLAEIYAELKRRNAPFEVVYLSCDQSEDQMQMYMKESHGDWLALPFGNPLIEELKTKYKVNAVPKLIILKPDGEVVTERGRAEVEEKGVAGFRNWATIAHTGEVLPKHLIKSTSTDEDKEETESGS
ncbi:nucleoredoxin-like protein 2 [Lingula anatina]|uniref:Nucleoredoxin-like protein 2 n=1 Tax=Lingula anatina TaxID=7574 RepID=A0A2R2MNT1_LINAN|nr:nucleoredoxin-like protein 2 [Lingula anatina]|eukprot:XP_023931876.1 nucleoredoxin-like protein 2 [Lingula anatina]